MVKQISFLGPHGTYTEEASRYLFDEDDQDGLQPCPTIADCLYQAAQGHVQACVVPIENSIEGSINITLDMLVHEVELPIRAEITVPISHTLYVRERQLTLDEVEVIYSHPQAIAQCRQYIRDHAPHARVSEMSSTAEACKKVRESEGKAYAAIGPSLAGQIYDLVQVEQGIEDYENNFTRFILAGEQIALPASEQHKTSLLVTLPEDYQGALYQVLAAFAWRKINLSKIESRPTKKMIGNYHFFIDVDQKMDDVLLPGAIAEIEALGCQVRLLGSYPSYWKKKRVNS